MQKMPLNYVSSDLSADFIADKRYDITSLPIEANRFDLIICYHILEHVENDKKAMSELFRVLRPGGTCFIQTPFKEGETYEDPSITTETDRLKHFGQKDHVRIYSIDGLKIRLAEAGFNVMVNAYEGDHRMGLAASERVLICTKA
ncbi:MAG: hypothetical protein Salg2KO_17930 [Salibacteraceae bacterium]